MPPSWFLSTPFFIKYQITFQRKRAAAPGEVPTSSPSFALEAASLSPGLMGQAMLRAGVCAGPCWQRRNTGESRGTPLPPCAPLCPGLQDTGDPHIFLNDKSRSGPQRSRLPLVGEQLLGGQQPPASLASPCPALAGAGLFGHRHCWCCHLCFPLVPGALGAWSLVEGSSPEQRLSWSHWLCKLCGQWVRPCPWQHQGGEVVKPCGRWCHLSGL